MRNFTVMFFLSIICSGCATTSKTDDLLVAHNACYSYIYGENGYKLNYDKAFEWCSVAADLGGDSAQTLLAELYLHGNGVEKNLETAAIFYEKAARQGHVHAQMMVFAVNNIYRNELSSDEEKAAGFIYLEKAVRAGYPKAIELRKQIYGQ